MSPPHRPAILDPPPILRAHRKALGYRTSAAADGLEPEATRWPQQPVRPKLTSDLEWQPVGGGALVHRPVSADPRVRGGATGSAPGHWLPSRGAGLPRAAVAGRLAGPSFRGLSFEAGPLRALPEKPVGGIA